MQSWWREQKFFLYRKKPNGKCVGPYIIYKRDEKMLVLNMSDIFIDASIDHVKPYYSTEPNIPQAIKPK